MLATAQRPAAPLPAHPPTDAADHALVFADGLVGFPDWRRFVLMTAEDEELPVATLCCLDVPTVELLITANLLGPLIVNPRTRQGRQVVLTESGYSTRHPVARLSSQGGDDACSS
jgi:flagellar assembly factor FliW